MNTNNNTSGEKSNQAQRPSLDSTILVHGRNRWKIAILICIGIIVLLLGLLFWKNYRLNRDLAKLKRKIESIYNKRVLRCSGLDDKDNAIMVFENAFKKLSNDDKTSRVYSDEMPEETPWLTGRNDLEEIIKKNEKAIAEACRACKMSKGYLKTLKLGDQFPGFMEYSSISKLVLYDALLKERQGSINEAAWQMLSITSIARKMSDSVMMGYGVGSALTADSLPAFSAMIHRNKLSKMELVQMETYLLNEYNLFPSYMTVIENEKNATSMMLLDSLKAPRDYFGTKDMTFRDKLIYYMPFLGDKWHVVDGIKGYHESISTQIDCLKNVPGAIDKIDKIRKDNSRIYLARLSETIIYPYTFQGSNQLISRMQATMLIIAIERYYAENGKYPEKIDGLVKPFKNINEPLADEKTVFTYTPLNNDYQLTSPGQYNPVFYTPWNAPRQ